MHQRKNNARLDFIFAVSSLSYHKDVPLELLDAKIP